MKIYGISQATGVERRLFVEQGADGIVLTITDHVGNIERVRIMVQADDLLAAITDRQSGGVKIEGLALPQGPKIQLHMEIRGNEVLIAAGPGNDVAVGLDDLQDAMEQAIGKG